MDADIIVVGAGVVGSAAAFAFARDGRKVILIERSFAEPNRIVGELLQPGGYFALTSLGLGNAVADIDAIPVTGYTVIDPHQKGPSRVSLGYPQVGSKPALGYSFHHGRFVQRLRQCCLEMLGVQAVEGSVTDLVEDSGGSIVGVRAKRRLSGATIDEVYTAALTVVCDGCFSAGRSRFGLSLPQSISNFAGLVLENCPLPVPEHGHVILSSPTPILLYQIGSQETRILVDVPLAVQESLFGEEETRLHFTRIVAPQLPSSLQEPFLKALATNRIRSMPNNYLPPQHYEYRGAILLGDSFNIRHPLTGGGMTVGLQDVLLLKGLLGSAKIADLGDRAAVRFALEKFFRQRKSYAATINILSVGLYRVFSTDCGSSFLRDGCFEYFKQGGSYQDEPMGLLAGLHQNVSLLASHFFRVALYSVIVRFRSAQWYQWPAALYDSIRGLIRATAVFTALAWQELCN